MSNLLSSLPRTIHASLALSIIFFLGLFYGNGGFDFDTIFWSWLTRLIHVTVATMWIGLLWYFNFVQIPNMAKIPDEQKPAIGKVIAPAALFYFRWAALITVISAFYNALIKNLSLSLFEVNYQDHLVDILQVCSFLIGDIAGTAVVFILLAIVLRPILRSTNQDSRIH